MVHVNSEFADQASDHDPQVVRLSMPVTVTHDITFDKNCSSPTLVGDPYRCTYSMSNDVDGAHDTLTVTGLSDKVHAAGGDVSSGNVLGSLQLVATTGSPTCTGGSGSGTTANPWVGVTSCTLPFGASIDSQEFAFYTVQSADYGQPGHTLGDTASLTWHDQCNDPAGTGNSNCVADPADATAESHTTVARLQSTATTAIHNPGHATVTTVEAGTSVHDFVTVSGQPGHPIPSGNVTIDWFLNGACTGSPTTSSTVALNAAGQVDATGFFFAVNSPGKRGFLAHYAGDATYAPDDGDCEPLRSSTRTSR